LPLALTNPLPRQPSLLTPTAPLSFRCLDHAVIKYCPDLFSVPFPPSDGTAAAVDLFFAVCSRNRRHLLRAVPFGISLPYDVPGVTRRVKVIISLWLWNCKNICSQFAISLWSPGSPILFFHIGLGESFFSSRGFLFTVASWSFLVSRWCVPIFHPFLRPLSANTHSLHAFLTPIIRS